MTWSSGRPHGAAAVEVPGGQAGRPGVRHGPGREVRRLRRPCRPGRAGPGAAVVRAGRDAVPRVDRRLLGQAATLHQLRHSALTHDAEDGASAPMLMTKSGHASIRTLGKYARPGTEALAKWQQESDRTRRGAGTDGQRDRPGGRHHSRTPGPSACSRRPAAAVRPRSGRLAGSAASRRRALEVEDAGLAGRRSCRLGCVPVHAAHCPGRDAVPITSAGRAGRRASVSLFAAHARTVRACRPGRAAIAGSSRR